MENTFKMSVIKYIIIKSDYFNAILMQIILTVNIFNMSVMKYIIIKSDYLNAKLIQNIIISYVFLYVVL